jgi:hypothetical protein
MKNQNKDDTAMKFTAERERNGMKFALPLDNSGSFVVHTQDGSETLRVVLSGRGIELPLFLNPRQARGLIKLLKLALDEVEP